MKIIDLLNKIANGEEVPKKIKYNGRIYEKFGYNNKYYDIESNSKETDILSEHLASESFYNDEVEIIEEDKKDEEIEIYINGEKVDITDIYEPLKQGEYFYKENGKWYAHRLKNVTFEVEEDKKIKKLSILTFSDLIDMPKEELVNIIKEQRFKINEIIEVLNERDI